MQPKTFEGHGEVWCVEWNDPSGPFGGRHSLDVGCLFHHGRDVVLKERRQAFGRRDSHSVTKFPGRLRRQQVVEFGEDVAVVGTVVEECDELGEPGTGGRKGACKDVLRDVLSGRDGSFRAAFSRGVTRIWSWSDLRAVSER